MPQQVTVRLPPELSQALEAACRRLDRRHSDIVRLALRQFLGVTASGRRRPAERVRRLLGAVSSGIPDLADRHREYVLESIRRGR